MSFNPDPNKQATEMLFSRKINSDDHPKLAVTNFNNAHLRKTKNNLDEKIQ